MILPSHKVLIINWHWDEELEYPSYPKKNPSLAEVLKHTPKLDVVSEENVSLTDGVPIYHLQNVKAHIFTPEVALNGQSDYIHQRQFRKQFVNAFVDQYDSGQAEFLFLFHKGDKIGTSQDFAKIQQTEPGLWTNARFEIFGGGFGTIYEEKGLLNHGISTFGLSGTGAAWFEEESMIKALAIKQQNFDYVWGHYWYQTQKKIKELRKLVQMIHISQVAQKTKTAAALATQNFLSHLNQNQYQAGTPQNGILDFSECQDLHTWVPREFRGDRLSVLRELADGKTGDVKAISHYFDDLIRAWKKL